MPKTRIRAAKKPSRKLLQPITLPCYRIFVTVTLKNKPVPGCGALLVIGNVATTPAHVPLAPAGKPTFTVHKTALYTSLRLRCTQGTPFATDVIMADGVKADQQVEIILQPCDER